LLALPIHAQSIRERIANALSNDDGDVPSARALPTGSATASGTTATSLNDPNAASLAAANCLQAGEQDKAASIALVFGNGGTEKGLVSSDISKYLVGLCVPSAFNAQYALNEYLLARGAAYSFYSERSLEELANYLESAGIELGIKVEALEKDGALSGTLSAQNDIDKAAFIMNQRQSLAENAAAFVPAIAQLQEEQRAQALVFAGRARSHAMNSAYFLSRGVYVSQEMSSAMVDDVQEQATGLRDRLRILRDRNQGNPLDVIEGAAEEIGSVGVRAGNPTVAFTGFVAKNGKALVATLANAVNIVRSFDTDVAEIPKLSQKELDADVLRLNEAWELPAEFADEDAYAATNMLAE
jgi:hypothetical protein